MAGRGTLKYPGRGEIRRRSTSSDTRSYVGSRNGGASRGTSNTQGAAKSGDAQDITEGYFQRLVEKTSPPVSPDQGRFRAYLLATLRNFMLAWHRDATTQKRGGTDSMHLSNDDEIAHLLQALR